MLILWITASVPNQTYRGTAEQNIYLPSGCNSSPMLQLRS